MNVRNPLILGGVMYILLRKVVRFCVCDFAFFFFKVNVPFLSSVPPPPSYASCCPPKSPSISR